MLTDGLLPAAIVPLSVPVPTTFTKLTPSFSVPESPQLPERPPWFCEIVRLNVEFRATPLRQPDQGAGVRPGDGLIPLTRTRAGIAAAGLDGESGDEQENRESAHLHRLSPVSGKT